ncbi:glycosyltransferase [Streptomyces sp. FH025]|uniref:glycosyltransferase family 2 protein n=1 Tax=Streptomyces sp. FH025 TaxID=2815937 RepID=UPI001A9CC577|nr:glycosyltransferase [Streptomyces sp. FH025]MBO1418348.1 glycosyltransferase [Streptomyces sp. FH025]
MTPGRVAELTVHRPENRTGERTPEARRPMTVPDATVVVAVHNAMPHLTACLDSLAGQSLAPGRLEVMAVDDGSTDGGEALLDEYAARHPGLFRVVHQPDSGGPAAPANRGQAMARGRYVLFLGTDGDPGRPGHLGHLGPEALERLVAAADAWGSDVVVPKRVGADGRPVPQGIFHANAESVGFTDSALAWALSDTKLFRLDFIRRHGLRRNEELKAFSDQPFTLEACLRAGRVSVLADYDCCFPAPRDGRGDGRGDGLGDVTERAGALDRLLGVAALQQVAVELADPGEELDAIRTRSFAREVPRLLEGGFLLLDDALQERVCVEVRRLIERFGARAVYSRLPAAVRVRLELAAAVRPDALRDQIRYESAHGTPPVVVDGRRHYAGFPAFRNTRLGLPDELFLLREEPVVEAAPPLNLAQQLWRGIVPEQVRRGLRRRPLWRRLANSVNGGRG